MSKETLETLPQASPNGTAPTPNAPVPPYPFTAIVGQEELKLALLLCVVSPTIGGVMVMGHRGTAKSTAVRALAAMLPPIKAVAGCPYSCAPERTAGLCERCTSSDGKKTPVKTTTVTIPVPVVDLPLGATEDRVCGTLDIERALTQGVQAFAPGLLARANRGFLYIDEVNLLEDHLVDVLLDVAASGTNVVEREGISIRHPARFVLVGSGNPEEGDLRPQLLDRFGLHARITTITNVEERVEIVRRRRDYDADPFAFAAKWDKETAKLQRKIKGAQKRLPDVVLPDPVLYKIAELCVKLEIDGHRGELTLSRTATALAAVEGHNEVKLEDVRRIAILALRHRLRKDPLETQDDAVRIERAVEEVLA
ncbi:magnesium chelatase ATPase subunit I [Candidatus Oscillochloris fontis]|uniref:magnesium chelatase ATPase subunit I n=1 Tax=Candidatus Oscillochloris fontis TaxID=2496868 RepID=UPI00101C806D|nr:magnesium chelatase ATPase subunit I [Candidatus Oscillochloris fontis]